MLSHWLNPDVHDSGRPGQFGGATPPRVALTGEVPGPDLQVGGGRDTDGHELLADPQDAEVGRVQVQVVGGIVALPHAAPPPLAHNLAAEHGSRRHVGDVRVESGRQVLGQRLAGGLERDGMRLSSAHYKLILKEYKCDPAKKIK